MGVGVGMGVCVRVGVSVGAGVNVGVGVGLSVGPSSGVGVGVSLRVSFGTGVGVGVGAGLDLGAQAVKDRISTSVTTKSHSLFLFIRKPPFDERREFRTVRSYANYFGYSVTGQRQSEARKPFLLHFSQVLIIVGQYLNHRLPGTGVLGSGSDQTESCGKGGQGRHIALQQVSPDMSSNNNKKRRP